MTKTRENAMTNNEALLHFVKHGDQACAKCVAGLRLYEQHLRTRKAP